ncbi:MAG: OsmC family protein [Candidatus Dormibacteraeota bacterium]|nr:OsmC family protein [Candidatus Dormibacteraeota bacterium]
MPADEFVINTVRSESTSTPGRSVSHVRGHQLVIDEPAHLGGPGEQITPAEAFLSGIAACGVLLVQGKARDTGVNLKSVEATIEGVRRRSDTSLFKEIRLAFVLSGPDRLQAQALVAHYQQH